MAFFNHDHHLYSRDDLYRRHKAPKAEHGPYSSPHTPVILLYNDVEIFHLVDEFFEALDADDFSLAEQLMRAARVDFKAIAIVLRKIRLADSEH